MRSENLIQMAKEAARPKAGEPPPSLQEVLLICFAAQVEAQERISEQLRTIVQALGNLR